MKRNPYFKEWSRLAQPDGYPDQITMSFGLTAEAQVTAVENGQADWMFDFPPADRLSEIGTKYADQVHLNLLTAFWYLPMNTNIPPFNNVKARRAVSLRDRPQRHDQDLRRAQAGLAFVPGASSGLPGLQAVLPVHEEPRGEVVGA